MNNSKSHRKKTEALGVNFSTATAQLKKLIIFQLLKDCGKDNCYRCRLKIENADDISIDHKKDWLNSGKEKELFWDIQNIAFSHKSCNTKAGLDKRTEFRGVTRLNKKSLKRRFQARVYEDGKQKFLGYFLTPEEAMEVVKNYKNDNMSL